MTKRWLWSSLGAIAVALSGVVLVGWSMASEGGPGREAPAGAHPEAGDEDGPEDGRGRRSRRFRLEGEDLDRVAWQLNDQEIRKDVGYQRSLDGLGEDERAAVLYENFQDLMTALAESRGGRYENFEAAIEAFRPYVRWLKERVAEDPIEYLRSRGAYRVVEKDVRSWAELFVDAFSDEDHVRDALERLDEETARRLYDRLGPAAARLIEGLLGQEYPSIAAKKEDLRRRLFDLRDRIAADPEGWLRLQAE